MREGEREGGKARDRRGREGGGEGGKRERGRRRERVDLSKLLCPFLILRIISSSQSHSIPQWYSQSRLIVGPLS